MSLWTHLFLTLPFSIIFSKPEAAPQPVVFIIGFFSVSWFIKIKWSEILLYRPLRINVTESIHIFKLDSCNTVDGKNLFENWIVVTIIFFSVCLIHFLSGDNYSVISWWFHFFCTEISYQIEINIIRTSYNNLFFPLPRGNFCRNPVFWQRETIAMIYSN